MTTKSHWTIALVFIMAVSVFAQQPEPAPSATLPGAAGNATYAPKYKGDPAQSESEFAALAYMRVVIRAEKAFNKQYGHYALTLNELVHSGTFTKRMSCVKGVPGDTNCLVSRSWRIFQTRRIASTWSIAATPWNASSLSFNDLSHWIDT